MSYKYVIFDFDGTVADSSEGVTKSILYAYESFGFQIPDEKTIRQFFGPPLVASFMKYAGVDEDTGEAMTSKYRELYTDNAMYLLKLYDGMECLLKNLKENGKKVAIASSKPKKFFDKLLDRLMIKDLFDVVCGAAMDEKSTSKKDIILNALDGLGVEDKKQAIMVGDRKYDVLGAKGAGVECIGVTFGFGDYEELKEAGADFIVDEPMQVLDIVT